MDHSKQSLSEYYCLGKENFSIDPFRDAAVFFGASHLSDQITRTIENNFVSPGGIPKFFLHGSFGSGKTHALAHIDYVLRNSEQFTISYPTEPIYLDIAPLSSRETWMRIHSRLLDAIGPDRISAAAEAVADRLEGRDKVEGFLEETIRWGDQSLKNSQANVFRNMLFGGSQSQMSWDWMKGKAVNASQSQVLGTQKNLGETQEFVNCLLNLGLLFYSGTNRRLVFLIDEAEAVRNITQADSIAEITHAYRMLLEPQNNVIGLISAIQAEGGQEAVGEVFGREDIRRRVGYEQGYVDLNGLVQGPEESLKFVEEVLDYLVDQEQARAIVESEGLTVEPRHFPFDESAIEAITEMAKSDPEKALPAAIIRAMSDAAIDRWRDRQTSESHLTVDADAIERAVYPSDA